MTGDVGAQSGDPAAPSAPGAPAAPPANAAEARAQRDADIANPAFADALDRGDFAARARWNLQRDLLNAADPTGEVAAAMSNDERPGEIQDSRAVELRGSANYLRNLGLNEEQVRETLTGKAPSDAEVALAKQWKAESFKSKEFRERLFAGEPAERQQLLIANIILSSVPERK